MRLPRRQGIGINCRPARRDSGTSLLEEAASACLLHCLAAVFSYCLTDSGTKIARITPTQITVYRRGFSSDQTCGTGAVPVLPNASRTAWATDDTGFHSAMTFSGPGRTAARTNVFAMNVSGKITMNEALFTTSTLGAFSPTSAMIQEMA